MKPDVLYKLPSPLHREWLSALLRSTRELERDPYARHLRHSADDMPWIECEIPRTHRRGAWTPCPYCRMQNEDLKGRERKIADARSRFNIYYVRVPPAIQEASPAGAPVAYWVGQCLNCRQVLWAADDGKLAETEGEKS